LPRKGRGRNGDVGYSGGGCHRTTGVTVAAVLAVIRVSFTAALARGATVGVAITDVLRILVRVQVGIDRLNITSALHAQYKQGDNHYLRYE